MMRRKREAGALTSVAFELNKLHVRGVFLFLYPAVARETQLKSALLENARELQ